VKPWAIVKEGRKEGKVEGRICGWDSKRADDTSTVEDGR
jgi:hypothetical protein